MTESILTSTKEKLGLVEEYEVFDSQIIDFINAAFSTVTQLGIGPPESYVVTDKTDEWDDILVGDKNLNPVKSYVFLKTKMLFDPPQTGYLVTAMENQITQLEWRLNTYREEEAWVPPTTPDEDM
jgi:hypothetical protein